MLTYLTSNDIDPMRIGSPTIGQCLTEFEDDVAVAKDNDRRVELKLFDELGRPLRPNFSIDE